MLKQKDTCRLEQHAALKFTESLLALAGFIVQPPPPPTGHPSELADL